MMDPGLTDQLVISRAWTHRKQTVYTG